MSSPTHATASHVSIGVYILEGEDASWSEKVRYLFNHPLFVAYIVKIDVPEEWLSRHNYLKKEAAEELYRYKWCLADAKSRMSSNYVLVIKDNSSTHITSQNMAEIIIAACQDKRWQVCYLNKWQDRCDLYTDKTVLVGTSTVLARTYSPHGCQALLFSPEGRDIVLGETCLETGHHFEVKSSLSESLNEEISKGRLYATCFVPNLVSVDVISKQDYYKTQECKPVEPETPVVTSSGGNYWIWLILIVLLFVLIWCFWCRRSRGGNITTSYSY
jgi:hypothetical protein